MRFTRMMRPASLLFVLFVVAILLLEAARWSATYGQSELIGCDPGYCG